MSSTANNINLPHYFFVDYLRVFACFLVVWHHTLGYIPGTTLGEVYQNSFRVFTATVPVFLVVSSFIFAINIEKEGFQYNKYIVGRVKRILVPYFSISVFTLIFRIIVEFSEVMHLDEKKYVDSGFVDIVSDLLFSGVAEHYYFLEIIFVYLIIYPFFVKKITNFLTAFIVFLLVNELSIFFVDIFNSKYRELESNLVDLVAYLFWGARYFLFGFFLYKVRRYFIDCDKGMLFFGGVLFVSIYAYFESFHSDLRNYSIYFLITSYVFFSLFLSFFDLGFVRQLSRLTYGVYIFHQPYFIKLSIISLGFFGISEVGNTKLFLSYLLSIALSFLFIVYALRTNILKKYFLGER